MPRPFVPMWRRIADDIRARIAAGDLKPGQQIETTAALMERYEVSSSVVRQAIMVLQMEDVLTGHQGRGVFVAER